MSRRRQHSEESDGKHGWNELVPGSGLRMPCAWGCVILRAGGGAGLG